MRGAGAERAWRRRSLAVASAALLSCGESAGSAGSRSSSATPQPAASPTPTPTATLTPTPTPTPTPAAPALLPAAPLPPGYQLTWHDEFDGAAIDSSRWNVFDWRRGQAQDTPDAVDVKDGVLRISTYTEDGVQKTGFLSTEYGKYDATHGYFEARIRFHGVSGQWCAFWLTSPTIGDPLGDPADAGAEIDIVEHRIIDESGWKIGDWVAQNVIWDGYGAHRADVHHGSPLPDGGPVNGVWHTFGVLWDDSQYVFYVDANEMWRTSTAVSQRSEYVLLTCEILDHDWAGNIPDGGYGPKSDSSPGMEVDWVRVWQK